jgi:hypothetical protein
MYRLLPIAKLAFLGLLVLPTALLAEKDGAAPFDVAKFVATLHDETPPIVIEDVSTIPTPRKSFFNHVCLSADGSRFAAMIDENRIYVWETKTGKQVSPINYKASGKITSLALSANGKYVLIGRDATNNSLLGESDAVKVSAIYKGLTADVIQAAITPDDKYVILCQKNGEVVRFPLLGGDPETFPKADGDLLDYDLFHITPSGENIVAISNRGHHVRMLNLAEKEAPPAGQEEKKETVNERSVAFDTEYSSTAAVVTKSYLIFNHSNELVFRGRPDQNHERTMQSLPTRAHWLRLSSDESRLVGVSSGGHVEMRGMIAPGVERTVSLGFHVRDCAISEDARTLALIDDKWRIVIKRLPEEFESQRLRISRTLQQLLAAKDYESLEAIFQRCEKDVVPFAWAPNRTPYGELCMLLETPPGAPLKFSKIASAIAQWSRDRPQASPPKIMLAQRNIQLAWSARGSGTGDTVTILGAVGFRAYVTRAEKLLVPLCDTDAPPPYAFTLLYTVAMAQQWNAERLDPYVDKLLTLSPHCLDAHFALAMAYLPRWGGAPEDLSKYAARVGDLVGGADGDGLYARFAVAQHFLHPPDHVFDGTGLDYQRTQRGLEHLAKTAPNGKFAACFGAWFATHQADNESLEKFCQLLKDDDLEMVWPDEIRRYEGDQQVIARQIKAIKMAPAVKP